jgi:hypothetical protein
VGFRFSKRVKIAPGVRLNLGLGGVSVSAGVRGASVTLGKRGLYGNVGLPGTGLSYRTKLAGGARPAAAESAAEARRACLDRLAREAEQLERQSLARFDVHLGSPQPAPFSPGVAAPPRPLRPGVPDAAPGQPRPAAWTRYAEDLAAWRAAQANAGASGAGAASTDELERRLTRLAWPRETLVSFDWRPSEGLIGLEVDLPEIEDLPATRLQPDARSLELVERPRPLGELRLLYARHVHAVLFRVLAEAFASLPSLRTATAAGYTQRPAPTTGALEDVYIVQLRADRQAWSGIDFGALDRLNPIHALERFELVRNLSARGVLSPIRRNL